MTSKIAAEASEGVAPPVRALGDRQRVSIFDFPGDRNLELFLEELDAAGHTERDAYRLAPKWVAALPEDLRRVILDFALLRTADALLIRGLPIGRIAQAATPVVHGEQRLIGGFEAISLSVAMMYGNPIGYATQQNGRLINDIVPLEYQADVANHSGGFTNTFEFHTEDAFMPVPPSFIQLACVRNPTATPVVVSGINPGELPTDVDRRLREPSFRIGTNPGQAGWRRNSHYDGPLLSGLTELPFIRYNDATTSSMNGDIDAIHVLQTSLAARATDVTLEPGSIVIVNNSRLAHARRNYEAKCDGTDRWLLRLVTYRNLDIVTDFLRDFNFPIIYPR